MYNFVGQLYINKAEKLRIKELEKFKIKIVSIILLFTSLPMKNLKLYLYFKKIIQ